MYLNLFSPVYEGVAMTLLLSYLLGLVHGITPDEHTWPITFSYAIGSYSTKKGAENGAIFSLGFTVQRALMSELMFIVFAYGLYTVKDIISSAVFFGIVYFIVGFVMGIAGYYVKYGHYFPHVEVDRLINRALISKVKNIRHEEADFYKRDVSSRMAFIHGLIAGFGFGAFALIIYFVFAPSMPNIYWGEMPGLLFGLGTMTMQFAFGAAFGTWITKVKKLGKRGVQFLARYMSSFVLLYGGITFMIAGIIVILFPQVLSYGITTPIYIHNLHSLGIGFFIVIFVVIILGFISYFRGMRIAQSRYVSSSV